MTRPNVVAVANEQVSIVTVCRMLRMDLPDELGSGRSRKVECPFGETYHSDGGVSPAMRIYPETNSAYCFSCSAYYTPVSLAAKAMDTTRQVAALRLLDRIGVKPRDLAAAWESARQYHPQPDKALMADALKTYCRRTCADWSQRQFEPGIARALNRCFALLELVKSGDDVGLWLASCKEFMRRAIHARLLSVSPKNDVLWRTTNDD